MSLFFWVFRRSHKTSINEGLRGPFFFDVTHLVKNRICMSSRHGQRGQGSCDSIVFYGRLHAKFRYYKNGEKENAKRELRKALELDQKFDGAPEAKDTLSKLK